MKKFINYVDDAIVESLSGLASAHEGLLRVEFDPTFVCRRTPKQDAVAVVSGGGSGHEPLHTGYVGPGHARRRLPGAGVHLADARPVDGRRAPRGRRPRRALHRQELRRRPRSTSRWRATCWSTSTT